MPYNYALSLFQLGADGEASAEAFQLVIGYYEHLGLEIADVFGSTPEHIWATTPDTSDRDDDLRHAGDSLDLLGATQRRLGEPAAMAYLHAMKFGSIDVNVGLGDLVGARNTCESLLLPIVMRYQLSELLIPVRAQYAVVLAWCGDIDAAREEMANLEAYQLTDIGAAELANQRVLIEQIATSGLPQAHPKAEEWPRRNA